MNWIRLSVQGIFCLVLSLGNTHAADKAAQALGKPAKPVKDPRLTFVASPLSFEPNVGQSHSSSKFLARGAGYSVQIAPTQAMFQFAAQDPNAASRSITMDLVNARNDANMEGQSLLPGKVNYFPGSDKATWHTDIPTYSRVQETGVYPGVDLTFYGNQRRLEYDFVVQPGADPGQIALRFAGADKASLGKDGELALAIGDQKFY